MDFYKVNTIIQLYLLIFRVNVKGEEEGRSKLMLANKVYDATKLINNKLTDGETKPDSVCVNPLILFFHFSKHLKNLVLFFFLDSYACISSGYFNKAIFL